jgi:hypothetical protein
MKRILFISLSLIALVGVPAFAASPFDGQPAASFSTKNAQAMAIAKQVYATTLKQEQGGYISTALLDLKHDKVAEIAVRFDFPNMRDSSEGYFTTILQFDAATSSWKQIFAHKASSLVVAAGSPGFDADIEVNHRYIFQYQQGAYAPQINSYILGAPMAPSQEATGALLKALDSTYQTPGAAFDVQQIDGGDAGALVAVIGDQVAAGIAEGPFMVWSQQYGTVLRTQSHGLFGLGLFSHGEVPDIIVDTNAGLQFFGWNAHTHAYQMYATSYVSSTSPAP